MKHRDLSLALSDAELLVETKAIVIEIELGNRYTHIGCGVFIYPGIEQKPRAFHMTICGSPDQRRPPALKVKTEAP